MSAYPSLGSLHIRPVIRICRPAAPDSPVRRLEALLGGRIGRVPRTVILATAHADQLRRRRTSRPPTAAPELATVVAASAAASALPERPAAPVRHAA
jgi:hypothetical protein